MIPKNIKREHIIKAIEEIEKVGTPKGRSSKKFLLEYNNKHYSPKYVISLANKYANGKELDPAEFSGGNESNNFLRYLGFNIVGIRPSERPTPQPLIKDDKIHRRKTAHDERCPRCKETIKAMLAKIYGKVEQNYKFEIGTHPEDFKNTLYYDKLKEIYAALQNYRRFKEFVKTKTLPNCDLFVLKPGFIVEFDESQHFTTPRKITLEKYPSGLELGFSREKWMELCEEINVRDNDPPYRDEQRAWYDTLRDFLPAIEVMKPTVRLFDRDFVWCDLNPDDPNDVEKFRRMVGVRTISVLAFGKELLGVLKTWQELHEPPAKPTAKSRLPARKPRQAQTATDSADVEQAMKRSGGDQRQKVDNSTGVRQRME